jgi:hypothetical protein
VSFDAVARRTTPIPRVELLEPRALLSAVDISLTTNQTEYQPGQPIQMTFTETNTSSQPVTVDYGPSVDGFDVTRDGVPVWQSNAGINPMIIIADTLGPGQSLTLHATWNGVPGQGLTNLGPRGTYTVTNQLDPNGASATFEIGPIASPPSQPPSNPPSDHPPLPPPSPPPNSSPITVSLTTNHQGVRRGQPVVIALTLKNSSDNPVAISPPSSGDGFSVLSGSTAVWHSARQARTAKGRTLLPGASVTFQAVWAGRLNQKGAKQLAGGVYTVEGSEGGYPASTTIAIDRPK